MWKEMRAGKTVERRGESREGRSDKSAEVTAEEEVVI